MQRLFNGHSATDRFIAGIYEKNALFEDMLWNFRYNAISNISVNLITILRDLYLESVL